MIKLGTVPIVDKILTIPTSMNVSLTRLFENLVLTVNFQYKLLHGLTIIKFRHILNKNSEFHLEVKTYS